LPEVRKRVASAIFDPGATEGYKGDRTLTEWQTDAVMRALAPFKGGAVPAPDKVGGHDWPTGLIDQICFATDCRPSEARAALASLKGGA